MKRTFHKFLSIILALALTFSLALAALADGYQSSSRNDTDIAYSVNGGNIYFSKSTGEITYRDETITEAVIPGEIDRVPVTSIKYQAFEGCFLLNRVVIPDSVTSIGDGAFNSCSSLTDMTIPNGIASIGECAFYNCNKLTDIYYGGTEEQWNSIQIDSNNEPLYNATIHYNSPMPDASQTATPVPVSTPVPVPEDAKVFKGHSYQVFDEGLSWSEAREACADKGGYLAAITSAEEQDFLAELIQPHDKYFYWLGATDAEQEGIWQWITGEPWEYTCWLSGQPDNWSSFQDTGENCLALERAKKGWNDLYEKGNPDGASVLSNSGYICEWDRVPQSPLPTPTQEDVDPDSNYVFEPDPAENLTLPTDQLNQITDEASAVRMLQSFTSGLTPEQKTSPLGLDMASLLAEEAAAKVATQKVSGSDIVVNSQTMRNISQVAAHAVDAVDNALAVGGVLTQRESFRTVTFRTDATGPVSCRIENNVFQTNAERVRIETPDYAVTFSLEDMRDSLRNGDVMLQVSNTPNGVSVTLPEDQMDNPVQLAMPPLDGDRDTQTIVRDQSELVASKINPATQKMVCRVGKSGTYSAKQNPQDFTDIANKSAEMQKSIHYLASKGIINGTTQTTFSPDGRISRSEIAALIVRALGLSNSKTEPAFYDVKPSDWYYYIAGSSQKNNLVNGFPDGTFGGNRVIPKDQIIAISSRVLTQQAKYKTPKDPSSVVIQYRDRVADWVQPEVALAINTGLIPKPSNTKFNGASAMTRGNAAIVLYKLFQKVW